MHRARENLAIDEIGEAKRKGGESPGLHKARSANEDAAEDGEHPCAALGAAPLRNLFKH